MRIALTAVGDGAGSPFATDAFVALAEVDNVGVHYVEEDPRRADAILVVDLHEHPADPFLRTLRESAVASDYSDKVYVYDQRDHPFFTFPGIYVSGSRRAAMRYSMVGGPYPNLLNAPEASARNPDLLYSFRGARTHPVRDRILALEHPRSLVEDTSNLNYFDFGPDASNHDRVAGRSRYVELIDRSKFVLCPRGHGRSSFRLYETLCAGRVPVVVSDGWLRPPLVDWAGCVIEVAEGRIRHIPRLLEEAEVRWPAMVAAGANLLDEHFSRSRLWHFYATSIANLRGARRVATPWWAQTDGLRLWARRARSMSPASGRRAG